MAAPPSGPPRPSAPASTAEAFLSRIASVRRAVQDGRRAPHKPLVLLYALAQLRNTDRARFGFAEAEPVIAPLLRQFAPPVREVVVANPFLRLENDGFWAIEGAVPGSHGVPSRGVLLSANPKAGFDEASLVLLRREPGLIDRAARQLLDANFPPSVHEEILTAIGLDLEAPSRPRGFGEEPPAWPAARRDPAFRGLVLDAYQRRCAFCGFSLRHGDGLIGVDAAHIRWHAFNGPDEVSNGIALCALHHRLFDLGILTLDSSMNLVVARGVNGEGADRLLDELSGRNIRLPREREYRPSEAHLHWHHREVFRDGKVTA